MKSPIYKKVWFVPKDKRLLKKHYQTILPIIREVARKNGYAIGLHGSMTRDLDLIAAPWVEEHSDHDTLLREIQKSVTTFESKTYEDGKTKKPCGRRAYLVHIGMYAHIDISIVSECKSL